MERELAENPEIVISHNPQGKGRKRMKRRKGSHSRRRGHKRKKALNYKLRVKFRGKLRTYKSLVKLKGRKFAKKKFRKGRKYHGRTVIGCPRPKKHSRKSTRRKHSTKSRKSRKGSKGKRKMSAGFKKSGSTMKIVWRKHKAALMRIPFKRRMKAAWGYAKKMGLAS